MTSTTTERKVRPARVVAAILSGDSYALSVMGHFGGVATAAKRRGRQKCMPAKAAMPAARMDVVQHEDVDTDTIVKDYRDQCNREEYVSDARNHELELLKDVPYEDR